MKLLFVCSRISQDNDAIGTCIENLRVALFDTYQIESDVLAFAWCGQPRRWTDACGDIILVDGTISNIEKTFQNKRALYLLCKSLARILCGIRDKENGQPLWMLRNMHHVLRENHNFYDVIITCSWPFCIHKTMLRQSKLLQRKWAVMLFDPYSTNYLLGGGQLHKTMRQKKEIACIQRSQLLFCLPEQAKEFSGFLPTQLLEKIQTITVPNVVTQDAEINATQSINFDKNEINCVYCGGLYTKIRRPDFFFDFLNKTELPIKCYFVGNYASSACQKMFAPYKHLFGKKIVFINSVPHEKIREIMLSSDILINLGNSITNQVPSKIFEYIALGKPILNFCYNTQCSSLPYLEGYPQILSVFKTIPLHTQQLQIETFLKENKGKFFPKEAWEFCKKYSIATCVATFMKGLGRILRN